MQKYLWGVKQQTVAGHTKVTSINTQIMQEILNNFNLFYEVWFYIYSDSSWTLSLTCKETYIFNSVIN